MLILDAALSPIEKLTLTRELNAAIAEIEAEKSPILKLKLTAKINELVVRLGGTPEQQDDGLSDDPNSPNYRYRDTGYIAGSRKEEAASMIRAAGRSGQSVRSTDIDWKAIEENPRQAADLITKANLFGKTDWDVLKNSGMEPAAGFLIQKIYASIASSPNADLPGFDGRLTSELLAVTKAREEAGVTSGAISRKDFAIGLETIRARLENRLTVEEVMAVVDEIKDELDGVQLTAEQADQVAQLMTIYNDKMAAVKEIKAKGDALYAVFRQSKDKINSLTYEQDKRTRRKWKPDPAIDKEIASLQPQMEEADKAFDEYRLEHPEVYGSGESRARKLPNGNTTYASDAEWDAQQHYYEARAIQAYAKQINLVSNQTTRSWISFGEKFWKLVHYRSYKGSDSFAGHIVNAKNGRIPDWSWSDNDRKTQPKDATQQEIGFHMKVASSYDRKGGKPVSVSSTKALEEMIGFRAIQSGNWVLKDPLSAKFHVENTAAAMSDMADILGIDTHLLGFGGRLGMAFGARGKGGKDAAAAHYEPVERVINITKMKGGGALCHEWLHALDNVMHEMVNQEASGSKKDFVTTKPSLLPKGAVQDAVMALHSAMHSGETRLKETIEYTDKDIQTAKYNLETPRYQMAKDIASAGNAQDAVMVVDNTFAGRTDRASLKRKKDWKKLAAAFYHNDSAKPMKDGGYYVRLKTGSKVSSYAAEAQVLDSGEYGKYWSQGEEMAARAFQAYIEDKLASQERVNDYLSWGADNKYHVDPLLGIEWKPFPEGEERARINAAYDKLFEALRNEKVFEKAVGNKALMDAIFGTLDAVDPDKIAAIESASNPLEKLRLVKQLAAAQEADATAAPEVDPSKDEDVADAAIAETAAADGIFMYDIQADQQGVIVGGLTNINRKLASGKYTEADIAESWTKTREIIRGKYGDTVTLYRAEAPDSEKHSETKVVYMADKSTASKFDMGGRRSVIAYRVPVDDILALNYQGNGYYEFIVKRQDNKKPADVATATVNPNAIEYITRDLFKGKPLKSAVKSFIKKFNGQENLFLGGIVNYTEAQLIEAVLMDKAALVAKSKGSDSVEYFATKFNLDPLALAKATSAVTGGTSPNGVLDNYPALLKNAEESSDTTFKDEAVDSYGGQINAVLHAKTADGKTGSLQYTVFEGIPAISMVEVPEDSRRRGIGSQLIKKLQSMYPDKEIEWGMMTSDGDKLRQSMNFRAVPTEYADQFKELEAVKKTLADYKTLSDEFQSIENTTQGQRESYLAKIADWNDLSDREWELEDYLRDKKPSIQLVY